MPISYSFSSLSRPDKGNAQTGKADQIDNNYPMFDIKYAVWYKICFYLHWNAKSGFNPIM